MWLPKDDRKVLVHYYKKLYDVDARGQFYMSALEKLLRGTNTRKRVKKASKRLKQRNLISFLNDQGDALTVQLSLEGYDLGRKYNSRRGLFVEWLKEYWLIVTLSGGIIGFLIKLLSSYLQRTPGAK